MAKLTDLLGSMQLAVFLCMSGCYPEAASFIRYEAKMMQRLLLLSRSPHVLSITSLVYSVVKDVSGVAKPTDAFGAKQDTAAEERTRTLCTNFFARVAARARVASRKPTDDLLKHIGGACAKIPVDVTRPTFLFSVRSKLHTVQTCSLCCKDQFCSRYEATCFLSVHELMLS